MIKFPDHAPFSGPERGELERLVASLGLEQRQWLSGYLAGVGGEVAGAAPSSSALTVLYGTESGNSEILADVTAKAAKKKGFKPRMVNMAEISPKDLAGMENLLVIVSTWGEGDPPETAVSFHAALMEGGPSLEGTRFSVCALGDTSYEDFCETGKQVDTRLEALGAQRVLDRVDCDVDFEEAHAQWLGAVLDALGGGGSAVAAAPVSAAPAVEYGKKHPFPAEVLDQVLLSGKGSGKETWHFELSLEGSGLTYQAGDTLAVLPHNAPDVVGHILETTGFKGSELVTVKGTGEITLKEALRSHLDITGLSRAMSKKYQALIGSVELGALLEDSNKDAFREFVDGRQIVDLLEAFPLGDASAADFVKVLRVLPPRLYSIASSPNAHPGEVHLTVAAVRYQSGGKHRKGVASTYLPDLLGVGDLVEVYVQPNKRFRLPEDDSTPIIMVGPGTGIAPYRAFVEERGAREASGKSWLFFGDRRYTYDFLYQLEWQDHLKSGALTRIDVAFSRDQPEKIYVQDRLREKSAEVFAWLEEGAHFYVCGDASRMAGDVHEALLQTVEEHGDKSREDAVAYVDQLKKDGRYQRDVY